MRWYRIADIRQLADVVARCGLHDGVVEIRIVLDRVEPPAGRLRVVPDAGDRRQPRDDDQIRFVGWLGLLKALYEVTGATGSGVPDCGE